MTGLRAGVVGVGYLGEFHARKYAMHPDIELAGIFDLDQARATQVADSAGCRNFSSLDTLLGAVDLVSIAVPTPSHYPVARDCLMAGRHVLLEKPITQTVAEAEELIRLAASRDLVFQVGHLERFNPAVLALRGILTKPLFIESHRLTAFRSRGTDINVVLDLMIHDIDIILSLVSVPLQLINSVGVPVLSDEVDIANARLQFENGCVANVTASRVSREAVRKIRIFQDDAYISIDYQERKITILRKGGDGLPVPGLPRITLTEKSFAEGDSLQAEINSFVNAVRTGSPPVVSGEDGKRALKVALEINRKLWHEISA